MEEQPRGLPEDSPGLQRAIVLLLLAEERAEGWTRAALGLELAVPRVALEEALEASERRWRAVLLRFTGLGYAGDPSSGQTWTDRDLSRMQGGRVGTGRQAWCGRGRMFRRG